MKEQTEKQKQARKEYDKLYRENNKDKAKKYREDNKEKISAYGKNWRDNNPDYIKKWHYSNKEHMAKYYLDKSLNIESICRNAYNNARARAKKYNRPFDITIEHLLLIYPHNHICPVRFVEMKPQQGKGKGANINSPTLDRINNNQGYQKDNVRFISQGANAKKGSR